MKKLRYKEIKYLAQSYKASKWWARIWTKMSWLLWGLVYATPWEPEWNWSRLGVLPLVILLSTFLVFSFSWSCFSSPFSFRSSPSTSLCFSISVPPLCIYSILFWPLTVVLFLYALCLLSLPNRFYLLLVSASLHLQPSHGPLWLYQPPIAHSITEISEFRISVDKIPLGHSVRRPPISSAVTMCWVIRN